MVNSGSTEAIERWQAKVHADIDRWERIRKKGVPSGYQGTHGENAGIEHVLGQGGEKAPKPEAVSGGVEGGSGKPAKGTGSRKRGVSQLDINELWRSWTQNYSGLVKLSTQATKEYSALELRQIYGITEPVKSE